MPIIKPVNGKSPQLPEDCYIAENATIVGDVQVGDQCSIWFNCTSSYQSGIFSSKLSK